MNSFDERKILLNRYFYHDRDFQSIGKACKISWFDRYDDKFAKDKYAYFSAEEKIEAIDKIASTDLNDREFADVLNSMKEKAITQIDRFTGEHIYFDPDVGFRGENRQPDFKKAVDGALKELGARGYYFLQAIINLYENRKWDRAYGGATWPDILAEIRRLGGQYPSPRDLAILKSFKLYYKTGSRRYPTHTIPVETLEIVKAILGEWKSK